MPASFKFVDNKTGENVPLTKIDDMLAEFLGAKPDEKKAYYMDAVSDLGLSCLLSGGGSNVTQEKFDTFIEAQSDAFKQRADTESGKKSIKCFRKFLFEDFTFHAWR